MNQIKVMKRALLFVEHNHYGGYDSSSLITDLRTAISQAENAKPVARLMRYIGKGTYPKKGYTVARTYEELPENTYPDSWEEGEELFTHTVYK
jgi:hypothetical protein